MLLTDKVEKALVERIQQSRRKNVFKLPEETTLAEELGVSRKTLRSALAKLKQRNLIKSVKGKGTFIVEESLNLPTNRTVMIGFIAPSFKHPMETSILEGIRSQLADFDYDLVLWSSEADPNIEAKYLKRAVDIGLSGLIWWPHLPATNHKFVQKIVDDGFPIVMIDRPYPGVDTPVVEPDNYGGVKKAVEYLIFLGHKKIGFVTGSADQREIVEAIKLREQAYLDAMREANLTVDERWIVPLDPDMVRLAGANLTAIGMLAYEPVHKLLALGSARPTAIVLLFDELAPGALKGIKNEGLNVPEDVSLIGFNDTPIARLLEVPLTTVRYPANALGQLAGQIMEKLLTNDVIENKKHLVETNLIIRSTTKRVDSCRAGRRREL